MYVYMYVSKYVCMYVGMYVCRYVCIYVCMYAFVYHRPPSTSRAFCKNPLRSSVNEAWRRRGPPPFRLRVHLTHNIYRLHVLERALLR